MSNKRKTVFNWFGDDWKRVKNHCRTTDNKDFTENDATDDNCDGVRNGGFGSTTD